MWLNKKFEAIQTDNNKSLGHCFLRMRKEPRDKQSSCKIVLKMSH